MSWECHRCGTVHADWSNSCWCRPPSVSSTCTVTITPAADRLSLLERQMRALEEWRADLTRIGAVGPDDGGVVKILDAIKAGRGPEAPK